MIERKIMGHFYDKKGRADVNILFFVVLRSYFFRHTVPGVSVFACPLALRQ